MSLETACSTRLFLVCRFTCICICLKNAREQCLIDRTLYVYFIIITIWSLLLLHYYYYKQYLLKFKE